MLGLYLTSYWGLVFLVNLLYCAVGIILFIRLLIKTKITVSKIHLFLIPSIILSVVLIYSIIMIKMNGLYSMGIEIPTILLAIGSPTLLFYYLSENDEYNLSKILCVLFPCGILISWIMAQAITGI
jgi:uncharacterized membrane protein YciS (DUF1049 family)